MNTGCHQASRSLPRSFELRIQYCNESFTQFHRPIQTEQQIRESIDMYNFSDALFYISPMVPFPNIEGKFEPKYHFPFEQKCLISTLEPSSRNCSCLPNDTCTRKNNATYWFEYNGTNWVKFLAVCRKFCSDEKCSNPQSNHSQRHDNNISKPLRMFLILSIVYIII